MKVAVVGHVEWIEFLRVESVPLPGEIVVARETWEEPAGGGGVAAVELARLAGASSLYCLLGGDDLGKRAQKELETASVRVLSAKGDEFLLQNPLHGLRHQLALLDIREDSIQGDDPVVVRDHILNRRNDLAHLVLR